MTMKPFDVKAFLKKCSSATHEVTGRLIRSIKSSNPVRSMDFHIIKVDGIHLSQRYMIACREDNVECIERYESSLEAAKEWANDH